MKSLHLAPLLPNLLNFPSICQVGQEMKPSPKTGTVRVTQLNTGEHIAYDPEDSGVDHTRVAIQFEQADNQEMAGLAFAAAAEHTKSANTLVNHGVFLMRQRKFLGEGEALEVMHEARTRYVTEETAAHVESNWAAIIQTMGALGVDVPEKYTLAEGLIRGDAAGDGGEGCEASLFLASSMADFWPLSASEDFRPRNVCLTLSWVCGSGPSILMGGMAGLQAAAGGESNYEGLKAAAAAAERAARSV